MIARRAPVTASLSHAASMATLMLIGASLAGCATVTAPAPPAGEARVEFPNAFYLDAHARGEPVFRIDADSLATIRVYRGGSLARFGHDHVVAARTIEGFILSPDPSAQLRTAGSARADLQVSLDSLSVDEPPLRAQANFDTQPSQSDIDGTRRNMLTKVLEVERFPTMHLHVDALAGEAPRVTAKVDIVLHGVKRALEVPIEIDRPSADALYVSGRFPLEQTDFGIAPLSILGGAVTVQNRIDIEFRLHATRVLPSQPLTPIGK